MDELFNINKQFLCILLNDYKTREIVKNAKLDKIFQN